jgi:hypothetical protein
MKINMDKEAESSYYDEQESPRPRSSKTACGCDVAELFANDDTAIIGGGYRSLD